MSIFENIVWIIPESMCLICIRLRRWAERVPFPHDEMTLIMKLKGEACLQVQNKVNVYKYVNALPFP